MKLSASRLKLIDYLYVSLLVLYVLVGMRLAPFHGDESTTIYVSHDWFRSPFSIGYAEQRPGSGEAMDQDLRLLNGVVSKDTIGAAFSLLGITPDQINTPWDWNSDWWVNGYYGHFPASKLLWIARLTSTLMTALSVAVIFTIGRRLAGRPSAWLSAFVYTLMPVVLLNGRRAMYEGATLLTASFVIMMGIWLLKHRLSRFRWATFGLICGLAIAAKHTNVLAVFPIGISVMMLRWQQFRKALIGAVCAALVAAAVFLILNPAWWSAPLRMPGIVLSMRQDLLSRQASAYPTQTPVDRLVALVRYPFGSPQYFEDAKYDWTQWIGSDIAAYEASGTAGLWGNLVIPLETLLAIVGMGFCAWQCWQRRNSKMILFLATTLFVTISVFVLTSVPWARYYLPLAAPFAIACGLSMGWISGGPELSDPPEINVT